MRFATFTIDGRTSYGIVEAGHVREAEAAFRSRHAGLRSVIAAGEIEALAGSVGTPVPLSGVTLLPPIPDPEKIICIGQNYLAHIREMGNEPGDYPAIFTRYPASMRGHGAPLTRPAASEKFDFEGELAVVIGRAGRAIPEASALEHVAGFTCFMDGSIRDFQRHTAQFWPGKNFVATGAVGPWIVTPDEAGSSDDLHLRTLLNGEEVQSSSVSDLACKLPQIIAYLSTVTELVPGDVIATGTPGGVGAARKPPLWLKAGDTIEVEISGIGTLSNPVVDET